MANRESALRDLNSPNNPANPVGPRVSQPLTTPGFRFSSKYRKLAVPDKLFSLWDRWGRQASTGACIDLWMHVGLFVGELVNKTCKKTNANQELALAA